MSAVQRLRRVCGFWQFVKHLHRMEQKRQDDLACNEEPWCLSGSDSSDGRSELDGESEVSDFLLITEGGVVYLFFFWQYTTPPYYGEDMTSASSLPCENLLASSDVNKTDWGTVHVVFTMSKLPVIFRDFFCACLVWHVSVKEPESRWFWWSAWHNHERGHSPWALQVQLGEGERDTSSQKVDWA